MITTRQEIKSAGRVVIKVGTSTITHENGRLDLRKADLIAYSHGEYYALGELLGKFGYSVKKPRRKKNSLKQNPLEKMPRSRKKLMLKS